MLVWIDIFLPYSHTPHSTSIQISGLWPSGNLFSCCQLFFFLLHMISFVFSLFFRWLPSLSLEKKERLPSLFPSQRCDAFVTQLFLVLSLGSCSDLSVMKTLCTSASLAIHLQNKQVFIFWYWPLLMAVPEDVVRLMCGGSNAVGKSIVGTSRLVPRGVATNLQFLKNAMSVKQNRTRYPCTVVSVCLGS